MKRSDKLFLNTLIIAIGTFTTKVLSFIMVPFYTLWLSPSEYGNFDLLISYIAFFIPFATFQLEQSVFRFSLSNKKEAKRYYTNAVSRVFVNILICNIIIILLLHKQPFMIPFMIYFDFYALYNCASEYLRGTDRLKLYSATNIFVALIIVVLNILLVYVCQLQVSGMLWSYAIAYLLGFIMIAWLEKLSYFKFYKNREIQKEMLAYSLPLIPNSISWSITHITDRTMIRMVMGSFYNGIYAISCKIPTLVNILFSIFSLSWQQTAISSVNDADKNTFYNGIYFDLIKFLYTSAMVIIALTPFLFRYFIQKEYFIGIYQIPIILNGIIFLSLAQFMNAIFLATKDTKSVGLTTVIAAIINFVINILFIKSLGLFAASLSTFVSYLVLFFLRQKKLSTIFQNREVIRMILKYNVVYILLSLILYVPFQFFWNLFCLISALGLFFLYNKRLLNTILYKFRKGAKKHENLNC